MPAVLSSTHVISATEIKTGYKNEEQGERRHCIERHMHKFVLWTLTDRGIGIQNAPAPSRGQFDTNVVFTAAHIYLFNTCEPTSKTSASHLFLFTHLRPLSLYYIYLFSRFIFYVYHQKLLNQWFGECSLSLSCLWFSTWWQCRHCKNYFTH